nr:hypothetical protein [uncultured Desulfobulbus sp.]
MADPRITPYLAEILSQGNKAGAWEVEDAQWTSVIMFYSFRGVAVMRQLWELSARRMCPKNSLPFFWEYLVCVKPGGTQGDGCYRYNR